MLLSLLDRPQFTFVKITKSQNIPSYMKKNRFLISQYFRTNCSRAFHPVSNWALLLLIFQTGTNYSQKIEIIPRNEVSILYKLNQLNLQGLEYCIHASKPNQNLTNVPLLVLTVSSRAVVPIVLTINTNRISALKVNRSRLPSGTWTCYPQQKTVSYFLLGIETGPNDAYRIDLCCVYNQMKFKTGDLLAPVNREG